ncbi:MAG: AI-2E family transporter [Spirochaetes bacterium]|uniref:AI-2E family transporter n=1 Tax=Candidatus Gallitreponema excrementavium TaxID=2840840 RepID=A0A9D9N1F0_9SPIR|nr:AI-2E family transporter [Candidatus Gallitreponema excrementavium]
MESEPRENKLKNITVFLAFISAVLFFSILKIMASVVIPIVIAVFLSFVLYPLVKFINKKVRIPGLSKSGVFGIISVIVIIGIAIYILMSVLFSSTKSMLSVYPKYEARLTEFYITVSNFFDLSFNNEQSLFENLWNQLGIRNAVQKAAISTSGTFINFFKTLMIILLTMFFLLLEFSQFGKKIPLIFKGKREQQVRNLLSDITRETTVYLSTKFYISLITGILVYLAFLFIGLDFPVLWGFLAFVLNFIPNIGSIAVGVGAIFFSFLQFWPEPLPIILVAVSILAIEMIMGNILEPKIQGNNLGLSPFIIITSLSFWGWLWGFPGMVLSVPMMVVLKIICGSVESLKPISILMGTDKHEKNNINRQSGRWKIPVFKSKQNDNGKK